MPKELRTMFLFNLTFGLIFTFLAYQSVMTGGFDMWTYLIVAMAAYDFFKVYQTLSYSRRLKKEQNESA